MAPSRDFGGLSTAAQGWPRSHLGAQGTTLEDFWWVLDHLARIVFANPQPALLTDAALGLQSALFHLSFDLLLPMIGAVDVFDSVAADTSLLLAHAISAGCLKLLERID